VQGSQEPLYHILGSQQCREGRSGVALLSPGSGSESFTPSPRVEPHYPIPPSSVALPRQELSHMALE
jgi:hypothetical protein